jgi:hypothetical protein
VRAEQQRDRGVRTAHDLAGAGTELVELGGRDDFLVCRHLKHRILGGVDDRGAGGEVLGAEVIQSPHAVVGPPAEQRPAPRALERREDIGREAARIGGQRCPGHHAHQLPVAGR